MPDKRSPQSLASRSQKRSKTLPLAPNDENLKSLCRHATVDVADNISASEVRSFSKPKGTEKDSPTSEENEIDNTKDNTLHASDSKDGGETSAVNGDSRLPVSQSENGSDDVSDAFVPRSLDGQLEPGLSEFDTRTNESHVEVKTANNVLDDLSQWQDEDSDSYCDAYVTPDYDYETPLDSPVHLEDLDKELGRWAAPPEPLRPENPYRKGKIIKIRKHTAPPPFGMNYCYTEDEREIAPERELRLTTLVKLCLDRPPSEGGVAEDEEPQTLEIVEEIRVKDTSGAQIVVCRFSGIQDDIVAKIYDPLYYGLAHTMWSDRPRDVTYEAEKDYCLEVAAYLELDEKLGGTEIPKYHGSWTFQMPLDLPDGQRTRDIRLVLMEHIKGKPMTDLKPEDYPESVGLELVARTIEAVSRIHFAGVRHGDVSQRNIMVCITEPDVVERLAMIDFNYAELRRLYTFRQEHGLTPEPEPNKPPNPIDSWWRGGLYGMAGEWLPKSWEMRLRASQEWLYERYGNSEEYMPPREPLRWDEKNVPQVWIAF